MFNEIQWKQYVKVFEHETEGWPYYIQWIVWCWRKPIWKGLPLSLLFFPIMAVDVLYVVVCVIIIWSQRREK